MMRREGEGGDGRGGVLWRRNDGVEREGGEGNGGVRNRRDEKRESGRGIK